MALLTYNGISLPFQKFDEVNESAVSSDDGIDQLYKRGSYTITSTFDAATSGLMLGGETIADCVLRLKHKLMEKRRPLSILFGGGLIVDLPTGIDAKGGPHPDVLSITKINGTTNCTIRFTVTTYETGCNTYQWLSNRWSESADITYDARTIRRRTGKLVIRPGELAADAFRGLCTPPMPIGNWERTANYTVQSDGLALMYSITDEEIYASPPPGAVRADGVFRVTGSGGIFRKAECSVKLVGHMATDKARLLALATTVCMDRLRRAGIAGIVINASISEPLYRNEVEVSFQSILQPTTPTSASGPSAGAGQLTPIMQRIFDTFKGKPSNAAAQPKPPESYGIGEKPTGSENSVNGSFDPGLRGTMGLGLVAAAFNDPCLRIAINTKPFIDDFAVTNITQEGLPRGPQSRTLGGGRATSRSSSLSNDRPFDPFFNPNGKKSTTLQGSPIPVPMPPPNGVPDDGVGPLNNFKGNVDQLWKSITGGGGPKAISYGGPTGLDSGTVAPVVQESEESTPYGDPLAEGNFISATLNVVDVLPEFGSSAEPDSLSGGIYTDYQIDLRTMEDMNMLCLPEQRSGGLVHYIPTGVPTLTLLAEWTATRIGSPPTEPDKDLGDDNIVYLKGEKGQPMIELADDGLTPIFRSAGSYRYGFKDPSLAKDGAAIPPYLSELLGKGDVPTIYGGPDITFPESGGGGDWETGFEEWLGQQPDADIV